MLGTGTFLINIQSNQTTVIWFKIYIRKKERKVTGINKSCSNKKWFLCIDGKLHSVQILSSGLIMISESKIHIFFQWQWSVYAPNTVHSHKLCVLTCGPGGPGGPAGPGTLSPPTVPSPGNPRGPGGPWRPAMPGWPSSPRSPLSPGKPDSP